MTRNNLLKRYGLLIGVLALVAISLIAIAPRTFGRGASEATAVTNPTGLQTITIEMAEDGTRFSPDEAPVFEDDGFPAYGAAFITQGYLYPEGTLANSVHGGALEDGSPEFPELVIGEWSCWGYHIGDGAHTEPGTGPWVVTTQLFSFGADKGAMDITSIGYEFPDSDEHSRSVVGGTGDYAFIGGVQNQQFLGWNDSVGVQLSIEFQVQDLRGYVMTLPTVMSE